MGIWNILATGVYIIPGMTYRSSIQASNHEFEFPPKRDYHEIQPNATDYNTATGSSYSLFFIA